MAQRLNKAATIYIDFLRDRSWRINHRSCYRLRSRKRLQY